MQVAKNIILQLKSIDVRFLEILKTALKVLLQQVGENFIRVNLLQLRKWFDEMAPVVQRALVRHQTWLHLLNHVQKFEGTWVQNLVARPKHLTASDT